MYDIIEKEYRTDELVMLTALQRCCCEQSNLWVDGGTMDAETSWMEFLYLYPQESQLLKNKKIVNCLAELLGTWKRCFFADECYPEMQQFLCTLLRSPNLNEKDVTAICRSLPAVFSNNVAVMRVPVIERLFGSALRYASDETKRKTQPPQRKKKKHPRPP